MLRNILVWSLCAFVALGALFGGAWLYATYRHAGGPEPMRTPPVGKPAPPPQPQTPPQPAPAPAGPPALAPQPEFERVDLATDLARFVIAQCHPAGTPGGGKQGAVTLTLAQLVERYAPHTALPAPAAPDSQPPSLGVELSPIMLEIVYAIAAGRVVAAVGASAEDAARAGPAAALSDNLAPRRAAELLRLSAAWLRGLAQCSDASPAREERAAAPASGLDCGYAQRWFDGLLAGQRDKERTVSKAATLLGQLSVRLEQRADYLAQEVAQAVVQ